MTSAAQSMALPLSIQGILSAQMPQAPSPTAATKMHQVINLQEEKSSQLGKHLILGNIKVAFAIFIQIIEVIRYLNIWT